MTACPLDGPTDSDREVDTNGDGNPGEVIELSGTQSTPLTLNSDKTYRIPAQWTLHALVEIEPGTTITMGSGLSIQVLHGGSLKAVGAAADPILIHGEQQSAGYWRYIYFGTDSIDVELSHVHVQDGGGCGPLDAAVYGTSGGRLRTSNTEITNSERYGLRVDWSDFRPDQFSENRITDSGLAPIAIAPRQMGSIDGASEFIGNTVDRIEVTVGGQANPISAGPPHRWGKTTVPFHIGTGFFIDGNVTVDPGARLEFGSGAHIHVRSEGSLNAIGTAADRIAFTGAQETKGYWYGIYFSSNAVNNELQYADVIYGGGSSHWGGAVSVGYGARLHLAESSVTNNERYAVRVWGDDSVFTEENNTYLDNDLGDVDWP